MSFDACRIQLVDDCQVFVAQKSFKLRVYSFIFYLINFQGYHSIALEMRYLSFFEFDAIRVIV